VVARVVVVLRCVGLLPCWVVTGGGGGIYKPKTPEAHGTQEEEGPVWYSFTSSFTTSIAKQPTLWSSSLKTHSHRVKHMVKLQKHDSLSRS
jgi:hypothetical protein